MVSQYFFIGSSLLLPLLSPFSSSLVQIEFVNNLIEVFQIISSEETSPVLWHES